MRAKEKRASEDEMVGWHNWFNDMNVGNLWEMRDREVWHAAVHGVAKSWTRLSDWITTMWIYVKSHCLHPVWSLTRNKFWNRITSMVFKFCFNLKLLGNLHSLIQLIFTLSKRNYFYPRLLMKSREISLLTLSHLTSKW